MLFNGNGTIKISLCEFFFVVVVVYVFLTGLVALIEVG